MMRQDSADHHPSSGEVKPDAVAEPASAAIGIDGDRDSSEAAPAKTQTITTEAVFPPLGALGPLRTEPC